MSVTQLKPTKPDTAGQLETLAQAISKGTYISPFSAGAATAGRIDQGEDFTAPAGTNVDAIGAGKIVGIDSNFFDGEPAIYEELTAGPYRGREVYYAEQLSPDVRVGQTVQVGQTIGTVAKSGTGLELGWGSGLEPLAKSTTGYREGEATAAGKSFAHFLSALNGPTGQAAPPNSKGFKESAGENVEGGIGAVLPNPSELASGVASALFGWLEEAFGALFVKALLYIVLAGGGAALIIAAFSRATGAHPVATAKRAAGRAALAGAAA